MQEYGITYVYEEQGEKYADSETVEANDADEAAEYLVNKFDDRDVDLVGDLEVYAPSEDDPELYPVA